jgi:hypothetical protein
VGKSDRQNPPSKPDGTLAHDGEHALPMFAVTDTCDSNWLLQLTGADLVRIFRQLENILTANEDDIRGWVDQLRDNNETILTADENDIRGWVNQLRDNNISGKGNAMTFISRQPVSDGPDEQLISLAELAVELTGGDINKLAGRIGTDAVLFDDIGRRAVTKSTARRLFTERAQAEAEQARRQAQWQKEYAELHARVRAQRRRGIPAAPNSCALADMMAVDRR